MDAIYIPRLTKAPQQTEVVEFNEEIPGLATLTPVQGQLKVTHQGTYLEVSANAETIITLTCDRCLQQYNYRLRTAPTELIWLSNDETSDDDLLDQEITSDNMVETLPPNGYFEPQTWVYEQLCLEIPQRQLCQQDCEGIALADSDTPTIAIDQRWSSLESLKRQLERN